MRYAGSEKLKVFRLPTWHGFVYQHAIRKNVSSASRSLKQFEQDKDFYVNQIQAGNEDINN